MFVYITQISSSVKKCLSFVEKGRKDVYKYQIMFVKRTKWTQCPFGSLDVNVEAFEQGFFMPTTDSQRVIQKDAVSCKLFFIHRPRRTRSEAGDFR